MTKKVQNHNLKRCLPAPNWGISRLKSDSVSIRELKLILMSVWTMLNCTLDFQYRLIASPVRMNKEWYLTIFSRFFQFDENFLVKL